MAALIQFLHRNTAYLLTIIVLWFSYKALKLRENPFFKTTIYLLVSMLIIQVLLGIFTLINCVGNVPVGLGVMHQAGALLLLTIVLLVRFQIEPKSV